MNLFSKIILVITMITVSVPFAHAENVSPHQRNLSQILAQQNPPNQAREKRGNIVRGTITAITDTTITIESTKKGESKTEVITVDANTKFDAPRANHQKKQNTQKQGKVSQKTKKSKSESSLSSLAVGDTIVVRGTRTSDGKVLATDISKKPARQNPNKQ